MGCWSVGVDFVSSITDGGDCRLVVRAVRTGRDGMVAWKEVAGSSMSVVVERCAMLSVMW